jgi:hypothetical protein
MNAPAAGVIPEYDFSQMAYVTNQLDRAMQQLGPMYGIPHFYRRQGMEMSLPGGSCVVNVCVAYRGQVQLEIFEPCGGNDEMFRRLLSDSDDFQVCFHHEARRVVSSEQFSKTRDWLIEMGYPLLYDNVNSLRRCIYADTRPLLGHITEYLWYTPEGEIFFREEIPHF